jgi:hypothetical protein
VWSSGESHGESHEVAERELEGATKRQREPRPVPAVFRERKGQDVCEDDEAERREPVSTVTTIGLAREVGLTPKAVRCAIHRGDLRATRIKKRLGRVASAAEFVIQRQEADDWKARRSARKGGGKFAPSANTQDGRRRSDHYAYFAAQDDEDGRDQRLDQLKRDALGGLEQARTQLRQPWEQGGIGLVRWWRAGIGEIV